MKRFLLVAIIGISLTEFISCKKILPATPLSEETLAEPLEGLTPQQLLLFSRGDAEFARVFGTKDGLGPIFVQTSCEGCHVADGKGNPFNNLTRFGKYVNGVWDPLLSQGGPQLQHRFISGYSSEAIPAGASVSQFIAPNASGLGFMETVSDAAILSLADSLDTNGDGISGTVNWVSPPSYFTPKAHHISLNGKYIGRFGRKSNAIDLLQQTAGAYRNDIGITSVFESSDPINYSLSSQSQNGDNVADPEIPETTVGNVAFYMRTLKAPPRRNSSSQDVIAGETIFIQTGCAKCHTPTLTTGASEIEPLNNKEFHPYTDLLLHDMGAQLDEGYTEGSAKTSEWRTSPLWGLGLQSISQGGRMFLLHDGRAKTFEEAISFHGGEGAASRAKFNALSEIEKQHLMSFLQSL